MLRRPNFKNAKSCTNVISCSSIVAVNTVNYYVSM